MNNLQIVCIACCYLPALIIEIMRRRASSDLLDESSDQTSPTADSVSVPFLTTVFLTLVGLAALVIAGIGVGNGVSSYLEQRRSSIAMLKVLGATSGKQTYPPI